MKKIKKTNPIPYRKVISKGRYISCEIYSVDSDGYTDELLYSNLFTHDWTKVDVINFCLSRVDGVKYPHIVCRYSIVEDSDRYYKIE